MPEVLNKRPQFAKIMREAASRKLYQRRTDDQYQRTKRYGQKEKLREHVADDARDNLLDLQPYQSRVADRTVCIVTRDDIELLIAFIRLFAKVRAIASRIVFLYPGLFGSNVRAVFRSIIDYIQGISAHMPFITLGVLRSWNAQDQQAIERQEEFDFFFLTHENTGLLKALVFLTSQESKALSMLQRSNDMDTSFFKEHISTALIDKFISPIPQMEWKTENVVDSPVSRMSVLVELGGQNLNTNIGFCPDYIDHGYSNPSHVIKGYKWLPKSAKRRLRKTYQKVKASEDRKERPLPKTIIPKGLAQWRKRKLKRGTDPFRTCQTVWNSYSCGDNYRVLCRWCDDDWEKKITRECWLKEPGWKEEDTRRTPYRFPHPCSICPWHEYPMLPRKETWAYRVPMKMLNHKHVKKPNAFRKYSTINILGRKLHS
jgi:hypothetical protein